MVTTTAPSPFLTLVSAGTDDRRPFPTSLFKRLLRADYSSESPQPGCCPGLGPNGSARPSLKRVRRRRRKIRSAPSGLLQSRYQQFQQHRAGLGRKNAAQGTRNRCEVPAASSDPGLEMGRSAEEAPAPSPRTNPVVTNKPFRKEVRRQSQEAALSRSSREGGGAAPSPAGGAAFPLARLRVKAAAAGRFHGR